MHYADRLALLVVQLRAIVVGVGDLVIGIMVGWFPHWHSSSSLVKLSHIGLPWHVIGALFIVGAGLIAVPKVRAIGYGLTVVFFFIAAWSLALVSLDAPNANGIAVVGLFMLAGIVLCGVITAQLDRGPRDVP